MSTLWNTGGSDPEGEECKRQEEEDTTSHPLPTVKGVGPCLGFPSKLEDVLGY